MEQHETFGVRLRRVRQAQGITAVALAKVVGISEAAIRSWETGRTEGPSLLVGLKIAQALCEDPDYLAYGTMTPTMADVAHDLEANLNQIAGRVAFLERD